ncbi:MAG: hypothetical protein COA56_06485 [Dehalococcoidia bacterium]|nr:MAG: hypothetical protein COA56_06485 [Dehalococcoidia bacterium]
MAQHRRFDDGAVLHFFHDGVVGLVGETGQRSADLDPVQMHQDTAQVEYDCFGHVAPRQAGPA